MFVQHPSPGTHLLHVVGDRVLLRLELEHPRRGSAILRTTLGRGRLIWQEIVNEVEKGAPPSLDAWHDLRMTKVDEHHFEVTLIVEDPGRFEAKAYFISEDDNETHWPQPEGNAIIHVLPKSPQSSTSIYQAFPRLFGQGSLHDVEAELDTIIDTMGFQVLLLLPIFPTGPSTHSDRFYASPFAPIDHLGIDSTVAQGHDDFRDFVDKVHAKRAQLWLDIPINHTGRGSRLLIDHPDWFCRDDQGQLISPGAWGVVWDDLVKLDFTKHELWKYLARVMLFWCSQGVDGFRCDAGHMIPPAVWRYLVAKVRLHFPDTVFLLEGLGGSWETNRHLLEGTGIGFLYSELFQKYEPREIRDHLRWCETLSRTLGHPVHFAETHDNDRLASVSHLYARMRTSLAALTSHGGAWGIANGVEWYAKEKISVYDRADLLWGNEPNLTEWIASLNRLLRTHSCFSNGARTEVVEAGNEQVIVVRREAPNGEVVWVVVNLDLEKPQQLFLWESCQAMDLLRDREIEITNGLIAISPGEAYCLDLDCVHNNRPCSIMRRRFDRTEVQGKRLYAILTNGRGAMAQVRGEWGQVRSQYDCLLGANISPNYPEDRRIVFTRCRVWVQFGNDRVQVDAGVLTEFAVHDQTTASWQFEIPVGDGLFIGLEATLRMIPERNAVQLDWKRIGNTGPTALADDEVVQLILRPDIEDRNFHQRTHAWPARARHDTGGFTFDPTPGYRLEMQLAEGIYHAEPEWVHDVYHDLDAERGFEEDSDLFSPGYFSVDLRGGEWMAMRAQVLLEDEPAVATFVEPSKRHRQQSVEEMALQSMEAFLVRRNDSKTVIAGYPWFLDWGRDSLIALRGFIAAGRLEEARQILLTFARFEDRGTLPNSLHGGDASDRDTSDAPLWFGVACDDLMRCEGDQSFLSMDCGGRTIREVLISIAYHNREGAPNGVHMDTESGLIFSPAHFTWMDTHDPPCTPREGYPIEIQALWFAHLKLVSTLEPDGPWQSLATRVRESTLAMYRTPEGLADCLQGTSGTTAADSVQDTSVRPNQLFAVTLGLIEDRSGCEQIIAQCQCLLVPGAIRSLAPDAPNYCGRYLGPEDGSRKPAYHNGTAWVWQLPSYVEALHQLGKKNGHALLRGIADLFSSGCVGHLPEILDGDAPYHQRGCGAQAWSVTEFYRVWKLIGGPKNA